MLWTFVKDKIRRYGLKFLSRGRRGRGTGGRGLVLDGYLTIVEIQWFFIGGGGARGWGIIVVEDMINLKFVEW